MTTVASNPAFIAYATGFDEVLGDDARLTLVAQADAHEGPVYFADENALLLHDAAPAGDRPLAVRADQAAAARGPGAHIRVSRTGQWRQRDGR
jgi:hypothetical protein